MRKWIFLCFVIISATYPSQAQEKITLEKIWGGAFQTQGMHLLNAMRTDNTYSILNYNPQTSTSQIDIYSFETLERIKSIISSKDYQELQNMSDYTFSPNEQKILIATSPEYIYRHSFTARYYVYDIQKKKLELLHDAPIQSPSFNNDGNSVAFIKENNIYIKDLSNGKIKTITNDGAKNKIINGITDWVYEEEFSFVQAYEWNADGTKIAFIKFDESKVPVFSMDVYGDSLYPTQQTFKYPKAGEANSVVSLYIYDVNSEKTQRIKLEQDYYIPRIKWTNDSNILSVQTLNRRQNDLHLYFIDAKNNKASLVLREEDKAYVDIHDYLTFLEDNSFIWFSEKDGYNHLYHYNKSGKLIHQITSGSWEVTNYYGFDEKSRTLYYQSVENGSTKRDVFQIKLDGSSKKQLSSKKGTNRATFSPDFKWYINQYESNETPPVYTLHDTSSSKEIKTIVNNESLQQKLKNYSLPIKEFFEIENAHGSKLNAYIMKPKDFDTSKKYPVLLYQYSGPGSQEVADKWWNSNDYWHAMLVEKGYLIVCIDGTGTGLKGANFKKATQMELGKHEVADQIYIAKTLGKRSYIDEKRIGIWGWSYGGFMSSNCLLQAPDVFKTAIAVAPVTNWRFYNTIYTERFLGTPQENPTGYDHNSPITYADQLKGNLLLIHGTADDNVHVQNAMLLINTLVHQNKNFDWLIYPDKNHGIYGGKTRLQLYTKMTEYILEKL